MRLFYDFRDRNSNNAKKYLLQGLVILKFKDYWLCWIYKDSYYIDSNQTIKGFIVAPRSIYLYNVYIARGFWDALKYFIKIKKQND